MMVRIECLTRNSGLLDIFPYLVSCKAYLGLGENQKKTVVIMYVVVIINAPTSLCR